MTIRKYKGWWGLYDARDGLICVCVYKKGAQEAERRFTRLCLLLVLLARFFHGPGLSHWLTADATGTTQTGDTHDDDAPLQAPEHPNGNDLRSDLLLRG